MSIYISQLTLSLGVTLEVLIGLQNPECRIERIDQSSTTIIATPIHTPLAPSKNKLPVQGGAYV